MAKKTASTTARDLARARRAWDKIRKEYGVGARIARALGVTRQCVHQWPFVPEEHVLLVQKVTRLPGYMIRPDLYRREAARPLESVAA